MMGTHSEAHKTVLSNKDMVRMIEKFWKDGVTEILEGNEDTIYL